MNPISYLDLVAFDQAHSQILNHIFRQKWGCAAKLLWGQATSLNPYNMPSAPTTITVAEYNTVAAANVCDFPFTWLYNLQVLLYAAGQLATDPTNVNAAALVQTIEPSVLLVVYGSLNVNQQLVILGLEFSECASSASANTCPFFITAAYINREYTIHELYPPC